MILKNNDIKKSFKRILKTIKKPEMIILPGNISYALILSIFPTIMIFGTVISKLNISMENIIDLFSLNIPQTIQDVLINFLKADSSIAWFTFILGLYFSSKGTRSIIVSANILYKCEEKNNLKLRVKSLFLVIIMMVLFVFILLVLGFGSTILNFLLELIGDKFINAFNLIKIFKWPISFLVIYMITKVLYTIAPSEPIKSRSVTKGALFTTLGWMIATFAYSIYVSKIARYDIFYGNLSSIVVLLIWIYLLSNILVIGMSINAEQYLNEEKSN